MERAQAKGEVAEEELRALEMDVTGKVSELKCLELPFSSLSRSCLLPGAVHDWKLFRSFVKCVDRPHCFLIVLNIGLE